MHTFINSVEQTLAYRAYLCLAHVCNMLSDGYTYIGSDEPYDDVSVFSNSISELTSDQITKVFSISNIERARLYCDRDYDVYYLAHPPTRPDSESDQATNVQVAENGGVPELFRYAASLLGCVKPDMRPKLVVTGHSLGGGLAAYSALSAANAVDLDTVDLNTRDLNAVGVDTAASNIIDPNTLPSNAVSSVSQPLTFAFDPLGLSQSMLVGKQFRGVNRFIDWYPIDKSFVPLFNSEKFLSSIGNVQVLEADPLRVAQGLDSHDLENVRHGLRRLWEINPTWRQRQIDLVTSVLDRHAYHPSFCG